MLYIFSWLGSTISLRRPHWSYIFLEYWVLIGCLQSNYYKELNYVRCLFPWSLLQTCHKQMFYITSTVLSVIWPLVLYMRIISSLVACHNAQTNYTWQWLGSKWAWEWILLSILGIKLDLTFINDWGAETSMLAYITSFWALTFIIYLFFQEISKLRYDLCPRVMKERKFWRVYFILVNSHVAA